MTDLPNASGAYVLLIDLDRPLALDIATLGPATLPPGRYAYCGSARGPGGIRARVCRHLRFAASRPVLDPSRSPARPPTEVCSMGGRVGERDGSSSSPDDKKPHWHVDRLTGAGRIVSTLAYPDGHECTLFARIRDEPGVTVPLPGFGSTDCRRCPSHLAAVPAGFSAP